jgi:flagellar basal body rod protein FlgF
MRNAIYGAAGISKSQKIWVAGSKALFYKTDGTSRDLDISLQNDGFYPTTEANKIEVLGTSSSPSH